MLAQTLILEEKMPVISFHLPRRVSLWELALGDTILRPREDGVLLIHQGMLTVTTPETMTIMGTGQQIVVVGVESDHEADGYYFDIDAAGIRRQLPDAPIRPNP